MEESSARPVSPELKKKRGRRKKIPGDGDKPYTPPGGMKNVVLGGKTFRRREPVNRTKTSTPFKRMHLWSRDEVNSKRIYLPPDWKCFATRRSSGIQKGSYDLIYIAPNGEKLRSRNEIYKWGIRHQSDLDARKFLFTKEIDVLFDKGNAKSIIFRTASLNHRIGKRSAKNANVRAEQDVVYNTLISDRGREIISDNNDDELLLSSSSQMLQGGSSKNMGKPGIKEFNLFEEDQTASTPYKKRSKAKKSTDTLDCLKSPYFAMKSTIPRKPVSIFAVHNGGWIPPRSPYSLIQEDLYHDPWQLLIATIFLNCTTGKLAIPIIHEFLARWPTPHEACSASLFDILEVVDLLGLGRTRAATIIRFSHEFLTVDWKKPSDLFGVGKYGNDSYKVFCQGQWRKVESDDKYLNLYINWMHNVFSSRPSTDRASLST